MGINLKGGRIMSKIKIVTDSASDISKEYAGKYDIEVIGFNITVGDKSFRDGDMELQEYYKLIEESPDLPTHSQLTVFDFEELYKKHAEEGVEELFYISINSYGSATYSNACSAKESFAENEPELAAKMNIRVIDSGTYSATCGYPVTEAAKMAQNGEDADKIEKYLLDWFDCCEVYLACYGLRFAKKSGRISSAAAFMGELMGFKPVILLSKGETKVVAKPRGEANVPLKLADVVCSRIEKDSPYIVIRGKNDAYAKEAAKELEKRLGYPPVDMVFRVGGVISANAGPDMVACAFKAKKK